MKRLDYHVSINGAHAETHHTWNASRRATCDIVRARLERGQKAEVVESTYSKDADNNYVSAVEIWVDSAGNRYEMTIEKEHQ